MFKVEMISDFISDVNRKTVTVYEVRDFAKRLLLADASKMKEGLFSVLTELKQIDTEAWVISELFQALMQLDDYKREKQPLANFKDYTVLECCGSGKKPYKLPNISTPSIIIAVSAGAKIIKKGSSATSSNVGSADLIYGLGIREPDTVEEQLSTLSKTGFAFVNIEKVIPKFNDIYNGLFYKVHALSFVLAATVSSLRGNKIIYGLSDGDTRKSRDAISLIDSSSDICVYSSSENNTDFFDELIGDGFLYISSRTLGRNIDETIPISTSSPSRLIECHTVSDSVSKILDLLKGNMNSEYSNVAINNAAFYLLQCGLVECMEEGRHRACDSIRSNKAYEKLIEIVECTGGKPTWI